MRCTCEQAVIEALEEVARWCGEQRLAWVDQMRRGADPNYAGSKASAYSAAEAHVNSLVDAHRAKAKA